MSSPLDVLEPLTMSNIADGPTPATNNNLTDGVTPDSILDGQLTSSLQHSGTLYNGKTLFDNTQTGFILGVDPLASSVVKFYLGNPTAYINWDGATLTIVGGLNVQSLNIPDTVTANSFHVDSNGNAWWGATTFGAALASVSKAGAAIFTNITLTGVQSSSVINAGTIGGWTASASDFSSVSGGNTTSISSGATSFLSGPTGSPTVTITQDGILTAVAGKYLESFTAGEALTSGDIVCTQISSTDYDVSQAAWGRLSPDAGSNDPDPLEIGTNGTQFLSLIQWDETLWPLPEYILKAELRLTVFAFSGGSRGAGPSRNTASWNPATVKYSTAPVNTADQNTVYGDQHLLTTGSAVTGDVLVFDITFLARQWKSGTLTNNGFTFTDSSGGRLAVYGHSNGTATNRPKIRIYSSQTSDGKAYKADATNYQLSRSILGVAQSSVSAAATIKVQTAGQISNVTISDTGGVVYLNSTPGAVVTSSNNLPRIITLGKITAANKFILNIQDRDTVIQSIFMDSNNTGLIATNSNLRFYAPVDARYVKLVLSAINTNDSFEVFNLPRASSENNSLVFRAQDGTNWTCTWGSNYAEFQPGGGTSRLIKNVYFYK